jgi:hypothetical protein
MLRRFERYEIDSATSELSDHHDHSQRAKLHPDLDNCTGLESELRRYLHLRKPDQARLPLAPRHEPATTVRQLSSYGELIYMSFTLSNIHGSSGHSHELMILCLIIGAESIGRAIMAGSPFP